MICDLRGGKASRDIVHARVRGRKGGSCVDRVRGNGRSQEALAHDAGLTVAAMARVERGQTNPTWTTVLRGADALGVSLAQLGRAIDNRRRQ